MGERAKIKAIRREIRARIKAERDDGRKLELAAEAVELGALTEREAQKALR